MWKWLKEKLSYNLTSGSPVFLRRAVFLLLFLTPIFFVGAVNYIRAYQDKTRDVLNQKRVLAYLAATTVHERLNALVDLGVALATRNLVIEETQRGHWTRAVARLDGVREQFPVINRMVLLDTDGIVREDLPHSPGVIGQSQSQQEWYRQVSRQWRPYVSGVYKRDAEPRINVISVAIPIKAKGILADEDSSALTERHKVFGILLMQFSLDMFNHYIEDVDAGTGGLVYIVDQYGQIVHHPKFNSQGEIVDFSIVPLVQKVLKGERGAGRNYNPIEREDRVAAFEPVPGSGWGVLVTQPSSLAFLERDRALRELVISYGIAFVMALGFGVFILYALAVQRKTEHELRRLMRAVEQSPVTIMITAIDGTIEYVNPKFMQLTGYSQQEAIGRNPRMMQSGKHSKGFYKQMWDTILAGQDWVGELYNKKKNGELFWELASISPVRNSEGRITHFIAVKEDITDRKKAEDAMQKAIALKSAFTSMVSHELRTPLGPIKEGVSIILDGLKGEVSPEQRELLTLVKNNAERLHRLIDDVLDFQKLDAGRMPFDMRDNAICEVIREVTEVMMLVAKQKQLQLKVECADDLPRIVFDRDKIVQVLTNLVDNAIKFTDQGAVTIRAMKEENAVHVVVEDTGPGIRPEDLPKLFHSFQQLKSLNDRKAGGTGLGLAISREIVMRHQGKIWADSELGKGAAFHFLLPIEERRRRNVYDVVI